MYTDKSCLYSTVKNISGSTMRFGFLPPHGVQLTDNEEYTVFGNILDRLTEARTRVAFAGALDSGLIEIVSTPAPILVDQNTYASRMLRIRNGVVGTDDPCWEDSDSLHLDVPA